MTEQLIRLFCLPLAFGVFLYAAQASGGLVPRDHAKIQVAFK